MSHSSLLAAAALVALVAAGSARAESQLDKANRAAAGGLTVLEVDRDSARFVGRPLRAVVPGPGERIVDAVPVPHVMNGGGFGLSGADYYSDATSEGRLGQHRHVNDYILAPALRAPLR